jgi:hypothetical protein
MSRYTVMFETRMIPATSWTVSRRLAVSIVVSRGAGGRRAHGSLLSH